MGVEVPASMMQRALGDRGFADFHAIAVSITSIR